jgi:hypothetical protein
MKSYSKSLFLIREFLKIIVLKYLHFCPIRYKLLNSSLLLLDKFNYSKLSQYFAKFSNIIPVIFRHPQNYIFNNFVHPLKINSVEKSFMKLNNKKNI